VQNPFFWEARVIQSSAGTNDTKINNRLPCLAHEQCTAKKRSWAFICWFDHTMQKAQMRGVCALGPNEMLTGTVLWAYI
jgi:hypothetical protein